MRLVRLLASAVFIAAAACAPEAPERPSWAADVYPILQARCIRCHGFVDPSAARPQTRTDPLLGDRRPVISFEYERFADIPPAVANSTIFAVLLPLMARMGQMPPPPAARLEEWQIVTLERWAADPF